MKLHKLSKEGIEDIAHRLKCLADVTRLQILQLLRQRELCVSEIVEELGAGQANISKHLQILARSHFVKSRRQGTSVHYSLYDHRILNICDAICANYERVLQQKVKSFER